MTALERALQEEKSKQPAQTSIPDTSDMDARLAALTQERDQLLAEKETWKGLRKRPRLRFLRSNGKLSRACQEPR
ncbi:hypothetical protein BC827DRAFT_1238783 [Russula dissimulans]|nr:hypothetical protein BC827DRAFT_1238783 [Russula dissimulans]